MDRSDRDGRRDVTDGGHRGGARTRQPSDARATAPHPLDGLVARTLVVTALLLLGAGLVALLGVFLWAETNGGRAVHYTDLYGVIGLETVLLYTLVAPVVSVGLAVLTLHLERTL